MLALLEPLFIFAGGNEESATKSFRVSKAWEDAHPKARADKTPHSTKPPFWIRRAGDRFERLPDQVAVVRQVHALAGAGLGQYQIAAKLNDAGVTPPRGQSWSGSTIRDIQGHEADRAFYLEAWSGTGSLVYDRIGRGTLFLPSVCVSVFGTISRGRWPSTCTAACRTTTG